MERRRFLQMMTAAAVGGAVGTSPAWASAFGGNTHAAGRRIARRPSSGDLPGIALVQNPWTASALNAEVAKLLIEEHLGNSVEITAIDENTMFSGLADGDLDACLELWPSGISADEQAYLDEGSVVEVGQLGAIGQIGWYVPRYVQEQYPETATWEAFLDPELAAQFASAETGDLGRFLGTDPSYSQYDETIIENLGLYLQVVFSGSEAATVAALDSAVAAQAPILMTGGCPPPRRRSTTSCRSSCRRTPTSAMPIRRRSPAPTPRTCSSRSPRRSSPKRIRR
jgi:ABC-type proline/glycine betaine transport system substrate-binding protein